MPAVISKTVLVLAETFGDPHSGGLDAEGVGAALARGLAAATLDCDLCPLVADASASATVGRRLDELDFDRRLRAARCLVIATARLDDRTLPIDHRHPIRGARRDRRSSSSVAFEAATRARQGGVPAYAVTAHNRLDPFEARIVDLQVVLEASSPRALSAAGRRLARLI
jgi:hypothetical protein